jgi:uncharacterized protein
MPLLPRILSLLLLLFGLLLPSGPAWAVAAADFPASAPTSNVLDGAEVLSRATVTDLENKLLSFEEAHVQARLVTLRRLDYGLSLADLGDQLLQRWQSPDDAQIVVLIETKSNSAAIRGDREAEPLLPQSLLTNTAETTMAQPLRDGGLYRQALVDGLNRLSTVLAGAEDPGPPPQAEEIAVVSNVPSAEETASSNARTWLIVLLAVGTVVPMATWWVFSR